MRIEKLSTLIMSDCRAKSLILMLCLMITSTVTAEPLNVSFFDYEGGWVPEIRNSTIETKDLEKLKRTSIPAALVIKKVNGHPKLRSFELVRNGTISTLNMKTKDGKVVTKIDTEKFDMSVGRTLMWETIQLYGGMAITIISGAVGIICILALFAGVTGTAFAVALTISYAGFFFGGPMLENRAGTRQQFFHQMQESIQSTIAQNESQIIAADQIILTCDLNPREEKATKLGCDAHKNLVLKMLQKMGVE